MTQLIISGLGETAKERLETRAKRHGRSVEAEARAILEDEAREELLEQAFREEGTPLLGRDAEKGFGDLMYERFKNIGLNEDEFRRFNIGIAEANSLWEMGLPDFEADEYEEDPPQ